MVLITYTLSVPLSYVEVALITYNQQPYSCRYHNIVTYRPLVKSV